MTEIRRFDPAHAFVGEVATFRDTLLHAPIPDAARLIWERPALAHRVESLFMAASMAGHDLGPTLDKLIANREAATRTPPAVWRGLHVAHVGDGHHRLDLAAALDPASRYLTQEAFDFLTRRGEPSAHLEPVTRFADLYRHSYTVPRAALAEMVTLNEDAARLALAFRQQVVNESAPHAHRVATGVYAMQHVPLAAVDAEVTWESLRLIIIPQGIITSICAPNGAYAPFWWSPADDTTTAVHYHATGALVLDVMLACVWRDACVVRHEFVTERRREAYRARHAAARPTHDSPVVFPRVVREVAWAPDAERDAITRAAHSVRGHYRALAEGRAAGADAAERADTYGYPPPPDGYTFVVPHARGGQPDAPPVARRVVCRGLLTAKIALG